MASPELTPEQEAEAVALQEKAMSWDLGAAMKERLKEIERADRRRAHERRKGAERLRYQKRKAEGTWPKRALRSRDAEREKKRRQRSRMTPEKKKERSRASNAARAKKRKVAREERKASRDEIFLEFEKKRAEGQGDELVAKDEKNLRRAKRKADSDMIVIKDLKKEEAKYQRRARKLLNAFLGITPKWWPSKPDRDLRRAPFIIRCHHCCNFCI